MSTRIIDPRIKIRHIACFLEVARLRSVVGAADALNISQPAATKTIQELEEILGEPLFDRTRRRLSLSGFGDVFYRYAATSLAALRQGIDAARGADEVTTVRIGALPSVSARILPDAVRQIHRRRRRGSIRASLQDRMGTCFRCYAPAMWTW